MKRLLKFLLIFLLIITVILAYNYKRLNIMAGFAAKTMASSVFLAKRDKQFTESTDLDLSILPIKIVESNVDYDEKSVTTSVLGIMKRKAVYRKGVGSVIVMDNETPKDYLIPKRSSPNDTSYYPYGNKTLNDTIFKNINYDDVQIAMDSLFAAKHKTRAVLVIHKDRIIAERYADGFDENSLLQGWSMTKSVTSTVFGVLQHQKKINVFDKAPIEEWQNDERKEITIHNLLQMNSGLDWDENYFAISDVTKMLYLEEDMTKSQMRKSLEGKPNKSWKYSSGTSNLLSGILRNQFDTHQEYLDYWYTDLIDKIGMNSMVVETDLAGNYIASSYSWAKARDWAKLGLLYLHKGNWNGEQIFDKNWVEYATTPAPSSSGEYGAALWLNQGGQLPDVPKSMYHFRGFQGKYVFVLPEQEMVIVRLGLVKSAAMMNDFIKGVIKAIE